MMPMWANIIIWVVCIIAGALIESHYLIFNRILDKILPKKYATCPKCGNQHMTYDTNCDPIFYCRECDHVYKQEEIVYRP